jgi:hypothetical protein
LYSWLLLSLFALKVSITQGWVRALRFYFWSTAIYATAMPLAALSFVKHFFVRAEFKRTPKNGEETALDFVESSLMVLLGLTALVCAITWLSPFSPVLAGQGVAYLSYPMYGKLCLRSPIGTISRWLVYIPGSLMLLAIYVMWNWARF